MSDALREERTQSHRPLVLKRLVFVFSVLGPVVARVLASFLRGVDCGTRIN